MSTPPTQAANAKPLNLAIIGGGFGGLALAICLLQHHCLSLNITIYESAPKFAEVGAGVSLGLNAARAISLISEELRDALKRRATYDESGFGLADYFLSFRWGSDRKSGGAEKAGDLIAHVPSSESRMKMDVGILDKGGIAMRFRSCVHRARFLDEMAKLIPEGVAKFGKHLTGIEDSEDGRLKISFEDGEIAWADAVIGCDGIKSKTRTFVMAKQGAKLEPQFVGGYAYRTLVPRDVVRQELGDERTLNGQLYIGYGTYMVTYLVERGELINIAAFKKEKGPDWDVKENWLKRATEEELLSDFADCDAKLVNLINRYGTRDKWGVFDLVHDQKYYHGNACLMGDSAHATSPHLGGGAGMAFEDAYVLGNLLAGVKKRADFEKVFQTYDAIRRPRTQRLVRESRLEGLVLQCLNEELGDDTQKIMEYANKQFLWVWDYDLEQSLVDAKKMSGLF